MKCPSCNQHLEQEYEFKWNGISNIKIFCDQWECPGAHANITIADNKITCYTLYFERNLIMYKLTGSKSGMNLYSKDTTKHIRGGWKLNLNFPQYITPIVKDDTIQIEYLVTKLQKLVVFS